MSRLIPLVAALVAVPLAGCGPKATTEPTGTRPTLPALPPIEIKMPPPDTPKPPAGGATDSQPDATRRTAAERLQLIHYGLMTHHDAYSYFPAGMATKGAVGLSWRVAILPYIREDNLFAQFKKDEPWDSEHNKKLLDKMPDVFASEGKKAEKGHTFLRTTRGPQGVIRTTMLQPGQKPPPVTTDPGQPVPGRRVAEFADGTSLTILAAESETAVPWTKPDEMDLLPAPQAEQKTPGIVRVTPPKLGGVFDGGFHALLGDGTVVFYKASLPAQDLGSLLTVAGGEPVEPQPAAHLLYAVPPAKK